ncbi:MAG: hypothetical protein WCO71_12115, partial [Pseudomonadota bacterium]
LVRAPPMGLRQRTKRQTGNVKALGHLVGKINRIVLIYGRVNFFSSPMNIKGRINPILMLGFALLQGCATQSTRPGTRLVSEAKTLLNLAETHRNMPSVAAGYYLDAAHRASRTLEISSKTERHEAILIYNRAAEELTVLLRSTPALWNRTQTFHSSQSSYRLHFASSMKQNGILDPDYFTFFRTRKQVREQNLAQRDRENGLGGILVGVNQPKDPRALFLPLVGVTAPVTVALDFSEVNE